MNVVITDYEYDNIEREKDIFAQAGLELSEYQVKSGQALADAVRDADAVVVQYAEMTSDIIRQMGHCKMIIKYGIGVNNIDTAAATEQGIYVCNVPDYGVDEVSNHAVALLLSLARKLPVLQQTLREGGWGYGRAVPAYRVAGSTLGLVSLGRIPSLVARKMRGFGVRLLAYDPFVTPQYAAELGVELVDFDTLCRESDYISIHCPLTPQTRHLFNKESFRRMKNTAILVNTARGSVVCEKDLIWALEQGEIAGAGLDVYEQEPLALDSPLLGMEQVICTGHCAWYPEDAIATLQQKAAEEVVRVLAGNDPLNCTNRRELAMRTH